MSQDFSINEANALNLATTNEETIEALEDYGPERLDFINDTASLFAEAQQHEIVSHEVSLWLISDGEVADGFLLTVDLTDGTRLSSTYFEPRQIMDRDLVGTDAFLAMLTFVTGEANRLCAEHEKRYTAEPTPEPVADAIVNARRVLRAAVEHDEDAELESALTDLVDALSGAAPSNR